MIIQYIHLIAINFITTTIIKASGKYKSCYNTEYLSPDNLIGQQTWIELDNTDITSVGNKPETKKTDRILLTNFQILDNLDNIDITFVGKKNRNYGN